MARSEWPAGAPSPDGRARRVGVWFGVPEPPRTYVSRPRLLETLDRARRLPLVLVSAAAGSGKTSLVAEWVARSSEGSRTGWLTFEEGIEDFWTNLVECLARLGVSSSPEGFPAGAGAVDRSLLVSLASAVAQHEGRLTVVVDDYELVSAEVANDVDFLLRHTGHRLQLVIVTRVDPVLPLYRYRLEDTLVELRMADLAFRDGEAADLLKASAVALTPESVHALNARTEGWAAGLRFAARILADRDDADEAVDEVVGDSGNIGEYLMGEVLDAQTPQVRQLLLRTSIPDTLQPGLAEELGGRSAARTLAFLTRVNAFVEPVPQHPGFYRYHPFFRDLLRAELAYESPQQVGKLQRKAARWFAREGLLTDSVAHFVAIDAWAEAAGEVVESLAVGRLLVDKRSSALARTLKPLPAAVRGPSASVVRATLALAEGDASRCGEELVHMPEVSGPGESSRARAVSLAVAVLQAVRARFTDDPTQAVQLAEIAEQALRESGHDADAASHPELAALVHASKGIATLRRGDVSAADELFTAGAGAATHPGCESLLVECLGFLALISCVRGRLTQSRSFADRAVEMAEGNDTPVADRPAAAQVALAWVSVEQDDLPAAAHHVSVAVRSDFLAGDPVTRTLLAVVRARIQAARKDLPGAISVLDRSTADITDPDSWLVDRLRIETANLRVANGEPEVAVLEVEGIEESVAEVALVQAQVELQQGQDDAVHESLARVLVRGAPLRAQVVGSLLEATRQLRGGSPARARVALERSLRLAAPERFRRPFREAPPAIQQMLSREPNLVAANSWLRGPGQPARDRIPGQRRPPGPRPVAQPPVVEMVENLTAKEFEVLGHLAELQTTEEIAAAMFVSVNTIRTHVRSILRKLGVSRRNAAVRRARDLRLLSA